MSDSIQSISQGNYILQGTVATSAGIVGDGSTQNPLRTDETVLWSGTRTSAAILSEPVSAFEFVRIETSLGNVSVCKTSQSNAGFVYNVYNQNNTNFTIGAYSFTNNWSTLTVSRSKTINFGLWTASSAALSVTNKWDYGTNIITKVIGINRISGSNA